MPWGCLEQLLASLLGLRPGRFNLCKILFIQVPQRVRILDLYITCRRMYVDQELVRSQLEEDASFFPPTNLEILTWPSIVGVLQM